MTEIVGKFVPDSKGKFAWEDKEVPAPTLDKITEKLLFIVEAQLFHGCTRKEALMLWTDGIDTLHSSVETTQAERMDK